MKKEEGCGARRRKFPRAAESEVRASGFQRPSFGGDRAIADLLSSEFD
jgi:hypothetical protein